MIEREDNLNELEMPDFIQDDNLDELEISNFIRFGPAPGQGWGVGKAPWCLVLPSVLSIRGGTRKLIFLDVREG